MEAVREGCGGLRALALDLVRAADRLRGRIHRQQAVNLLAYGLIALSILSGLAGLYGVIDHGGVVKGRAEVQSNWDKTNEKARLRSLAKDEENRKKKELSDADNAKSRRDLAGLYAAYTSLRDKRRNGSLLPAAPSTSAHPDRITFDRKGFDNALSGFDKGVTGLLNEGDAAITDLNSAKDWAKNR